MTDSNPSSATPTPVERDNGKLYSCLICGYSTAQPQPAELGRAPGNTQRFKSTIFPLWQCPKCQSIHSVDAINMEDIYSDYPLNRQRQLDVFARGTLRNLSGRLIAHGLTRDETILDFGCGNGVYIEYLNGEGYNQVTGYDPYVAKYADKRVLGTNAYDCVIANDVIEHVDNPRTMLLECLKLVKPGGLLYVGTADSQGVKSMADLEPHIMRLHQPFHRVILTQSSLLQLGTELRLSVVQSYSRSYMDTLMPFSNYRFLDEFNKAHGHNLDLALASDSAKILLRKPTLLFYALFGYFIPSAIEPAVLWRKASIVPDQP